MVSLSRMLSNVYGFVCNMTMLPCLGSYESVDRCYASWNAFSSSREMWEIVSWNAFSSSQMFWTRMTSFAIYEDAASFGKLWECWVVSYIHSFYAYLGRVLIESYLCVFVSFTLSPCTYEYDTQTVGISTVLFCIYVCYYYTQRLENTYCDLAF